MTKKFLGKLFPLKEHMIFPSKEIRGRRSTRLLTPPSDVDRHKDNDNTGVQAVALRNDNICHCQQMFVLAVYAVVSQKFLN